MESKENILVIDDELGIREGCKRVLKPQGFLIETAASLREGLQKVRAGSYDLVLLDVMLPDGRGVDLVEQIHAKDPNIVCVIITGYATVELAVNAIKVGAYDFISKPFTADLLLMTVNQGLEKRRLSLEASRLQEVEREKDELVRAKEEMERLDEFKSAFTVLVAHELRSPVGGAQSLVRTLLKGMAGELNEKQSDLLKRVDLRLSGLLELVNDLLVLAKSKTLAPDKPLERVELQPFFKGLIEHFLVEAGHKRITLDYQAPQELIVIRGNEDGLQKVFGNLVGNAIKYTPEGGRVQVSLTVKDEQAEISVADTGIGIPEEDLARLGEEFFRAGNAKSSGIVGTGLGMSIVKQYIQQFRGSLAAQSKVGEGTTFTVHLPLDAQSGWTK